MRLTPDFLLRIARETSQKRALAEPDLAAVYLTGSLLRPDPLLGGAGDIDLVIVHAATPPVQREIVPLTAEVHLDILHRSRADYARPRQLRADPFLGPELYNPAWLYESQHFLEFVQAGVRDKFDAPENVLARARLLAERARQAWSSLQTSPEETPARILAYLEAVADAANAVAALNGPPLAERRLLLEFPLRAEAVGAPGLAGELFRLLGSEMSTGTVLEDLLPEWETAFLDAASRPKVEARIHAARLGYYKLAFEAILSTDSRRAILWPLLHTWALAALVLPAPKQARWLAVCEALGLAGVGFYARMESLDGFLDLVEEILDNLAREQGL
ncbi:MAG: hypothetical protein ABWK53_11935 [Anaerolineales bacterium]